MYTKSEEYLSNTHIQYSHKNCSTCHQIMCVLYIVKTCVTGVYIVCSVYTLTIHKRLGVCGKIKPLHVLQKNTRIFLMAIWGVGIYGLGMGGWVKYKNKKDGLEIKMTTRT